MRLLNFWKILKTNLKFFLKFFNIFQILIVLNILHSIFKSVEKPNSQKFTNYSCKLIVLMIFESNMNNKQYNKKSYSLLLNKLTILCKI